MDTLNLTPRDIWHEMPDAEMNERLIQRKSLRLDGKVYVSPYVRRK